MLSEVERGGRVRHRRSTARGRLRKVVEARREKVIKTLTGGVAGLFKKNEIDCIEGDGSLTGDGKRARSASRRYAASKAIMLATGSVPKPIPGTRVRRARHRHRGGVGARGAARDAGGRRRRRVGRGDRLGLRAPRHEGPPVRGARPRAADRGRRHLARSPRARSASRASRVHTGDHGRERRGAPTTRSRFTFGDDVGRGRLPRDRRRPRRRRRGPRARRGGRRSSTSAG